MSWLLFMDESGHDHRNTPYEVRGGVAIHITKLWSFIQKIHEAEKAAFGTELSLFKTEIKGEKLLDKDRYAWAAQEPLLNDETRKHHCRRFLTKGLEKQTPSRSDFTAYGQASIKMATDIFDLLDEHEAKIFASVIPKGAMRPPGNTLTNFLRKDQIFMLERFFYLLEENDEHGVIVMDEVDKNLDRKFVKKLQNYFKKTQNGMQRASRIVPSPFFVSSDMSYPVQAADLCIYCINWGFRRPQVGMNSLVRQEIQDDFSGRISRLQYYMSTDIEVNVTYQRFGIVYEAMPYESRQ